MGETYQGWANYETWAVALWLDNDRGIYDYWRRVAMYCWESRRQRTVMALADRLKAEHDRAVMALADRLKAEHDTESVHPVFAAACGSVYSDLLQSALAEVDWQEIAQSLLEGHSNLEEIHNAP